MRRMTKVGTSEFLRAAQVRTARIAASGSATRRQGPGAARAARRFLATVELRRFGVPSAATFRQHLDKATGRLVGALPRTARSWGLARKLLNIFLRDALYTTYLCKRFGLRTAEKFFEIPLDSITSRQLRAAAGRGALPRWTGVKHLRPDVSKQYQLHAALLAEKDGLARVHLDTYWWGERDDETGALPRVAGNALLAARRRARPSQRRRTTP